MNLLQQVGKIVESSQVGKKKAELLVETNDSAFQNSLISLADY